MKKFYCLLILAFTSMLLSKGVFYLDYACYDRDRLERTKVDIYISVPIQSLEFDKSLTSVFSVKIYVYDGDKLIAEDKWKQKYTLMNEGAKYSGAEVRSKVIEQITTERMTCPHCGKPLLKKDGSRYSSECKYHMNNIRHIIIEEGLKLLQQ